MRRSIFSIFCMTASSLNALSLQVSYDQKSLGVYDIQDRPSPLMHNPIKGLSHFLFFPMYPAKNKEVADKIFVLVKSKLNQYGLVSQKKMTAEVEGGQAIDLSVLKCDATLIYKIDALQDIFGKDTGLVRASLNLDSAVEVIKTKETCNPYIWSANCFLKGSLKKEEERLVSQSLDYLLNQFLVAYQLVSDQKPHFELQGADL